MSYKLGDVLDTLQEIVKRDPKARDLDVWGWDDGSIIIDGFGGKYEPNLEEIIKELKMRRKR